MKNRLETLETRSSIRTMLRRLFTPTRFMTRYGEISLGYKSYDNTSITMHSNQDFFQITHLLIMNKVATIISSMDRKQRKTRRRNDISSMLFSRSYTLVEINGAAPIPLMFPIGRVTGRGLK